MNNPKGFNSHIPLCVDCDGTLLHTDLLHESVFLLLKQAPWALFILPFWLFRGKAYLKARIAERVTFNWSTLPYRSEVMDAIAIARGEGRAVMLATAAPRAWADGVAAHLGVFDAVIATEESLNLSAANKADRLIALYGSRGFDYAGNGWADVPVWAAARTGIVVSSSKNLIARARVVTQSVQSISVPKAGLFGVLKCLRVHQWLKNLLVLVPLLAAHQVSESQGFVLAGLAFLAFSFCASAVYVLNDLLDLESDRQHIRKCKRPFASGLIPVWHGIIMVPLLLAVALGLASWLPGAFGLVLAIYFVFTLAYSLRLKRQVIVDVMLLAALYTMRIIAGTAATDIVPSFWLLAFSMFIFLSLAIVKRYSELWVTLQQQKQTAAGRGYTVTDLPVLASLGAGAGMAAVLVLALYINDPETARLYPERIWLWLVPPAILYWVSRIWLKTCRGEIDDDPVVFAVKDWQSLLIGGLLTFCFVLAASPWAAIKMG